MLLAMPPVVLAGGGDSICDPGQGGLLLPLFGNKENRTWDNTPLGNGLRATIYFFGLIWAFLGVSIVADIFMAAIETITSAEKKIKGTDIVVKVWNPTVANLTLMALGSSAPEILLSVIEIMSNGFFTGDLGPSTIVGSASFNLLVITAICVTALPDGEMRAIEDTGVFRTTSFFSIFAYVWLLIILMGPWSPDVVELWEAVLTFMFFPLLVLLAYGADKKWFKLSARVSPQPHVVQLGGTHYHPYEFSEILKKINSEDLTKEEQAELIGRLALQVKNKPSRAVMRMNAIRMMTAQKRKTPKLIQPSDHRKLLSKAKSTKDFQPRVYFSDVNGDMNPRFAFLENDKNSTLGVMRNPAHGSMKVKWATRDGTAKAGDDYEKAEGVLTFEDGEVFKEIEIKLHDDEATEDDECFYVDLLEMHFKDESKEQTYHQLGPGATAEVTIIDDDEPGEIGFLDDNIVFSPAVVAPMPADTITTSPVAVATGSSSSSSSLPLRDEDAEDQQQQRDEDERQQQPAFAAAAAAAAGSAAAAAAAADDTVSQSKVARIVVSEACENALVKVRRINGSTGDISCEYETVDGTAVQSVDYRPKRGKLCFKSHEVEKSILVPIINNHAFEGSKEFHLKLSNLQGPSRASFHERRKLVVVIEADKETKELLQDVQKYVAEHESTYTAVGTDSWFKQFQQALFVNGGDDGDDFERPGAFQYVMHALTLPWKLLFAFVPPTCYCGGWACFVVALVMIGIVTAFVGDLAALFGCQIGLPDTITAITFVALGTSLPDAFASKAAALSDDNADASVGNVTGSNSVNVFLGLGLPWTIASIYWSGGFASDKAKKKWHNRYGGRDNDGSGGSKGPRGGRKIGEDTPIAFVVPAGDLGLSVMAFVCCGLSCLVTLAYRRKKYGAELGGPKSSAKLHAAFFVALWFTYIAISCMSTLDVL
ncbi:hypothetical protein CTAYLR_002366 [Chrysophaeum taylorii]|uniref:Calx-beta domain-containing protein n=1 Tax=Chrysophaeum taylorii TaxID=2483200 RepID=A0AAD7UIK1_9STRA|nr:hypothetical protein CTAYLR_002366 [Chrysophaeum taylorii]